MSVLDNLKKKPIPKKTIGFSIVVPLDKTRQITDAQRAEIINKMRPLIKILVSDKKEKEVKEKTVKTVKERTVKAKEEKGEEEEEEEKDDKFVVTKGYASPQADEKLTELKNEANEADKTLVQRIKEEEDFGEKVQSVILSAIDEMIKPVKDKLYDKMTSQLTEKYTNIFLQDNNIKSHILHSILSYEEGEGEGQGQEEGQEGQEQYNTFKIAKSIFEEAIGIYLKKLKDGGKEKIMDILDEIVKKNIKGDDSLLTELVEKVGGKKAGGKKTRKRKSMKRKSMKRNEIKKRKISRSRNKKNKKSIRK